MKEGSNDVRCKSEKSHQGSEGQRTHFRNLDKDPDVHRDHDHRVEESQQLGDHDLVVGLHEDAGEDKDADEIDEEAKDGDDQQPLVLDLGGLHQPLHCLGEDEEGDE